MNIFGVGPGEIILILIIALVVVGPERLPDLARRAGQMLVSVRNWMQASPDAQMVLRMRQELEQELTSLRSSLNEVQSVRDEVIDAARQINKTVGEDIIDPIKDVGLEVKKATDTVARGTSRTEPIQNGNASPLITAEGAPLADVTDTTLVTTEGAPLQVSTPVTEPTIAPPMLGTSPTGTLPVSSASDQSLVEALAQINQRLDTLFADLRSTQDELKRRGLLPINEPSAEPVTANAESVNEPSVELAGTEPESTNEPVTADAESTDEPSVKPNPEIANELSVELEETEPESASEPVTADVASPNEPSVELVVTDAENASEPSTEPVTTDAEIIKDDHDVKL